MELPIGMIGVSRVTLFCSSESFWAQLDAFATKSLLERPQRPLVRWPSRMLLRLKSPTRFLQQNVSPE